MKSLLKICALLTCCITLLSLHGADTDIPVRTTFDVQQLADGMSLDDMLTILSAGKLKALTNRPDILQKLMLLETQMDEAFKEALSKIRTMTVLTEDQVMGSEIQFKQHLVLTLYAALHEKAQQLAVQEGTPEQKIILAHQLTAEELSEQLS